MSIIEERIDFGSIKKILVIQFRPFGDVLLATSYLEALSERFSQASIEFLVKKPFEGVLNKNPWISRVIPFEEGRGIRYVRNRLKLFHLVRNRGYDLIIDQQHGTGSVQVVFFSKAAYKLGWSRSKFRWCYNLRADEGPARYQASQNFDMLGPLGVKERPFQLFYHVTRESDKFAAKWLKSQGLIQQKTIILSPGSPRKQKKWRAANFAALADRIMTETDMRIVVLWGPKEYDDAQYVCQKAYEKPLMAPPTNFNQGAAFLKRSRLLICNDGGINHLSVALGVPSLAIFGKTSPERWSAEGTFPNHYHLHNPDGDQQADENFGITPEQAFNKVMTIL